MTDADILTKALNKAINSGYSKFKKSHVVYAKKIRRHLFIVDEDKYGGKDLWCVESIIFSHDFARAFWGEEEIAYAKSKGGFPTMVGIKKGWKDYFPQNDRHTNRSIHRIYFSKGGRTSEKNRLSFYCRSLLGIKNTMKKTQAKITVIILLFQTVTILFLVVSMVLLLGNALDRTFESQDIMLCESAKVSGNSEYLKKCACYYQSEKISCIREIK